MHEHLFGAIAADLGDAATPEVVAAWDRSTGSWRIALIKLEKGLYGQQANDVMFAPFKLIPRKRSPRASLPSNSSLRTIPR